ncbi:hypothetical protein [Tsuneonella sp. HG222]
MTRTIIGLSSALALAACGSPAPSPSTEAGDTAAPVETPAPVVSGEPTPPAASPGTPEADPSQPANAEEKAARGVLLEWARSLEVGQLDRTWATWGKDAEARSGMTRAQHDAYWQRFKTITIAMPTGTTDGAAGSLYYTAPTTVVGKTQDGRPYRLEGEVVLRRVNDVPGASADQLAWHIEKVDLNPA